MSTDEQNLTPEMRKAREAARALPHGFAGAEYAAPAFIGEAEEKLLKSSDIPAIMDALALIESQSTEVQLQPEVAAARGALVASLNSFGMQAVNVEDVRKTIREVATAVEANKIQAAHEASERWAEMKAMHRKLYDSDPIYRAATDKITAEVNQTMDAFTRQQQKMDKLASEMGITTALDADVVAARAAIARSRAEGSFFEDSDDYKRYMQLVARQNALREQQLRAQGNSAAADQFHTHSGQIDQTMATLREGYHQQAQEFINAKTRQLKEAGKPPQEIEELLKIDRAMFAAKERSFKTDSEIRVAMDSLKDMTTLTKESQSNKKSNTKLNDKSDKVELTSVAYEVAEASLATSAVPGSTPAKTTVVETIKL